MTESVEAAKIHTGDSIDEGSARGMVIHRELLPDGSLRFTVTRGPNVDTVALLVDPTEAVTRTERGPVTVWQADA